MAQLWALVVLFALGAIGCAHTAFARRRAHWAQLGDDADEQNRAAQLGQATGIYGRFKPPEMFLDPIRRREPTREVDGVRIAAGVAARRAWTRILGGSGQLHR